MNFVGATLWQVNVTPRPWVMLACRRLREGVTSSSRSLLCFLAALFFFMSNFGVLAATGPEVGTVNRVENPAQVGSETAVEGTVVHMNDELRTGPKGRLQVTFRDGTTLTLGEKATVSVDRYVYNPEKSTGELALKTGVAAFRLATGKLSEMRNKDINVKTPAAALAIRGTDVWWGPIDGQFGVLLVEMHAAPVGVSNEAGGVTLAHSGEGTDIDPLKGGGGPGKPYQWPPEKIARALSQTSFGLALNPAPAIAGAAALAAIIATTTQQQEKREKKPSPASP